TETKRVYVFESAYDAMAYWQLHHEEDRDLRYAVFVSTGGNPTRGQMQGLIRTAPGAAFHLCFDNDEAGRQFTANFMTVAKEMKPYSDVARAFRDTPGKIGVDHEKESALFRLPGHVKEQYFKVEGLQEDLREGYLCQEDKNELRAQIAQGWRVFNEMVDACIVHVERELPGEGYKDFNDELLGREMTERKAVGCDLDGDGAVETEESHEERHRYHR
ncbi:MAG: toprim domain-containing protein, partial [Candidatus Methanomethylophilus sp.]|nr:toprim domain-containing protein [Methanomethylophilus sp.]